MTRHRTLPYLLAMGILLIGTSIWWSFQVAQRHAELNQRRAFAGRSPLAAQMRPATAREKQAALTTIRAQLEAFRRDDYISAAKYQSQTLKKNFSSTAAFRRSIRESYPQFANYQTVAFGLVSADKKGTTLVVPVTLTGRDKVTVRGVYLLTREGQAYRITSVLGGVNPRQKPPKRSPGNTLSPEVIA